VPPRNKNGTRGIAQECRRMTLLYSPALPCRAAPRTDGAGRRAASYYVIRALRHRTKSSLIGKFRARPPS
jgi:hypothetical protein